MPVRSTLDWNKMAREAETSGVQMINGTADIIANDLSIHGPKGVDVDGKAFKPLKASTIASKRRKGSPRPDAPLFDTGRMLLGIRTSKRADKTQSIKVAHVTVPKTRDFIASVQMFTRDFFGVSKRTDRPIDKLTARLGGKITRASHK